MLKFVSGIHALESLAKNRIVSLKIYLILFFSYLLALLIPLLSITLYFNIHFTSILEKEIITGNYTDLEQIMYMVNSQMEQVNNVREQIKSDETIKSININEMPTKGKRLIQNLNDKIKALPFIEEAIVYFHDDSYAFSSKGSYSLNYLFLRYKIDGVNEEEFYKLINNIQVPRVMKAIDEYGINYVVLTYPLPDFSTDSFNYNKYNKTLLFFVPENSFMDIMKKRISSSEQNTYILDDNNNLLVTASKLKNPDSINFESLIDSEDYYSEVNLNGAKYYTSTVESDLNSWKYVTFLSAKSIQGKIVTTRYKYFWFIFMVLTFGLAVVLLLTTLNYQPIKRLKYKTKNLFPQAPEDCNELEYVSNALGNLVSQNKSLQSDLLKQADITKEYLFFRLLKGDVKTTEEFNETGRHIGVAISKPLYMVIIVQSPSIVIEKYANFIIVSDSIKAHLSPEYEFFIKDHSGYNSVVAILGADSFNDLEFSKVLLNIYDHLNKVIGMDVVIGAGNTYTNLCEVSKSYVEAMTAIDYRYIIENERIIFYNTLGEKVLDTISLPFSSGRLKSSIIQYKKEDVQALFTYITDQVKDDSISVSDSKKLCLGVLYLVVENFNKLGDKNLLCDTSDVFHISEFEDNDDFVVFLDRLCRNIQVILEHHINSDTNTVIIDMISYLKANYDMFDFSLQKMADHFNMPTSVLSQYFKDYTDMNIVDYLADLRIQKAKELLLSSELTIKDISTEVGYYNVNSFIRRFKQVEGVTPGDFRKENAE